MKTFGTAPAGTSSMRLAEFIDDRTRMFALSADYRRLLNRERPTPGQRHRMRSGRGTS